MSAIRESLQGMAWQHVIQTAPTNRVHYFLVIQAGRFDTARRLVSRASVLGPADTAAGTGAAAGAAAAAGAPLAAGDTAGAGWTPLGFIP